MAASPDTVDAYLAALPPARRERLEILRAVVHRIAPDVTETIEWQMPVYRSGEHYLAMASRAAYVAIYLGEAGVDAVRAAVPGLKAGKGCLNIGDRTPLPLDALEAAIRARLAP